MHTGHAWIADGVHITVDWPDIPRINPACWQLGIGNWSACHCSLGDWYFGDRKIPRFPLTRQWHSCAGLRKQDVGKFVLDLAKTVIALDFHFSTMAATRKK